MCHLRPQFLLIFCLDNLSNDVSVMLKSPNIVLLLISPFIFVNICFMYLGDPMLGAYTVTIVNYWINDLFGPMIPLSLCNVLLHLITVFVLKSILSDISIATPVFFSFPFAWNTFFHPLTFSHRCCLRGLLNYPHFLKFFFLFLFSLGDLHYSFSLLTCSSVSSNLLLIPSSVFFISVIAFLSSVLFYFIFSNSLLNFSQCSSILLPCVEHLYDHYL